MPFLKFSDFQIVEAAEHMKTVYQKIYTHSLPSCSGCKYFKSVVQSVKHVTVWAAQGAKHADRTVEYLHFDKQVNTKEQKMLYHQSLSRIIVTS